jgi:hypothetical protein
MMERKFMGCDEGLPDELKQKIDDATKGIIKEGKKVASVMAEHGCNIGTFYGDKIKITIEAEK